MKIAKTGLISIFSIIFVFHVLVINGVIDYHLVWGGRINNREEMLKIETVSLVLNFFFLMVILIKTQVIKVKFPQKLMKFILWLMLVLFAFNTIGNLISNNIYEKIIFTPITALIVIFLSLLIKSKPNQSNRN